MITRRSLVCHLNCILLVFRTYGFNPEEVGRIIRAARAGPEGSLNAICMLDDDITLFMHAFPDADDRELRAQCHSTLLEYEESMQTWEEARDAGELDSSSTDSEDEGELAGDDQLQDLERPAAVIGLAATLAAQPSYIDWPKKVLRQTILVQHWMAEALEGAARASELMGDRIALAGMRCPRQGGEENRSEAGDLSPAARRAAQAVMRAATADPLSDSQLERVVRLALGKRVPATSETCKAAVAHTTAAVAGGGGSSQAPVSVAEFICGHQIERRTESEGEDENRPSDPVGAGESSPAASGVQPAPPEPRKTATQAPSEVSEARSKGVSQSGCGAAAVTQGRRKKNRTARRAARAVREAGGGSPTAGLGGGAGGQASSVAEPPGRKRMQCPVFGCMRKHTPDDCPTFLDMTPKERLDLVHMKQLCLLCLQHSIGVGCEAAGRGPNCAMDGCGKPHHEMLHEVLKAGESSPPAKGTDPPGEPTATAAANKAPELVRQLQGLLEDLGIDTDALEVRIGIWRLGEQGRPHSGGGTIDLGAMETGERKLTSKLLEAVSLLCRAGERFMSCMGESQQRMIEVADPAAAPGGGPAWSGADRRCEAWDVCPGEMAARRQVRSSPRKAVGMMRTVAARVAEAWRAALALGAGKEAPRSARDSGVWWC
jgi:hypothetical protein